MNTPTVAPNKVLFVDEDLAFHQIWTTSLSYRLGHHHAPVLLMATSAESAKAEFDKHPDLRAVVLGDFHGVEGFASYVRKKFAGPVFIASGSPSEAHRIAIRHGCKFVGGKLSVIEDIRGLLGLPKA